jgi:hypothetical protein
VLNVAKNELDEAVKAKKISQDNADLRLQLLKTLAGSKLKFAAKGGGGLKELTTVDKVNDKWNEANPRMACLQACQLTIVKANIDLGKRSDFALNLALPSDWLGVFQTKKKGASNVEGYQKADLLPGDQVWFINPYWLLFNLDPDLKRKAKTYEGEAGSNTFYLGNGKVIDVYANHKIQTIAKKQKAMRERWKSPDAVIKKWNADGGDAKFSYNKIEQLLKRLDPERLEYVLTIYNKLKAGNPDIFAIQSVSSPLAWPGKTVKD